MIQRGEIWWASRGELAGSAPEFRRPILVVPPDSFNASQIQTVVAAAIASHLRLAAALGNVLCWPKDTGLPKKSTINVSHVVTINKRFLRARIGVLPPAQFQRVEDGLRLVLAR